MCTEVHNGITGRVTVNNMPAGTQKIKQINRQRENIDKQINKLPYTYLIYTCTDSMICDISGY